jgi:chromosome segregation ATPase
VELAGGEATDLLIPEILERQTRITLQTLTRQQLVTLTGPETPQSVRNRLGEIVDVQEEIAALREEIRTAETRIETLFRDQERLRENLRALGDGSADLALRTRYLDQLTGQEDAIDADRAAIAETTVELAETTARLGALISSLSFSG